MHTGPVPDAPTSEIRALLSKHAASPSTLQSETRSIPVDEARATPKPLPHGGERSISIVNLNSASKTRLMTIPGVGEATAERILQHRSRSPFGRPEDIMLVKGIGEKRFEKMRPYITAP
ncbi:MAG: helix-hairpin-helix domain-containing protein [Candidatus Kapabacteria bacterium]|nr:helix-hairpin-helix domain-containing protein [Candidatus Kapabacteria bacterium]